MRVLEIVNKKGLHARASAKFVQTVEQFDADVRVTRGSETRRRHLDHGPDDARRRPPAPRSRSRPPARRQPRSSMRSRARRVRLRRRGLACAPSTCVARRGAGRRRTRGTRAPCPPLLDAQQRRRMDGDEGRACRRQAAAVWPRTLPIVTGAAEHAARRGRAERHDHRRACTIAALALEPPAAALDLVGVRPLVQAPLAAHLVLEMLHRVGDEASRRGRCRRPPAPGRAPGRPDRRTACRRGPPGRPAARRPA